MTEAGGAVIADMISRGWDNFLERPRGSLNLRFVIQSLVAAAIALRAGVKDAREDRPAYLWATFTSPGYRLQLLRGGWREMRTPFLAR